VSKRNVSLVIRVLVGLIAAFAAEFVVNREIGILEPSASSIFRLEVNILTFICAMVLAEEVVTLLDDAKPTWKHRCGKLLFLLSAFSASIVIFGYLVRFLRMTIGPL
jgi:hypothetical protein